ncbi:MAG: hypothetical protein PHS46_02485 [Candidatus Omnitrophica bacterium]|nr:hypothetical protein [Candidatus Omnitrophota bacterium]
MKKVAYLFTAILFISGCAWQRIPAMPTYNVSKTIPIKVGVVLGDTSASFENGYGVVKNLKEMRVFDEIIFPYEKNNQVDGILKMDINGGWNSSALFESAKGTLIGLSMGTLGMAIGSSGTGTHDAIITLNKGSIEVARYSVHIKTTVECGIKADLSDVDYKAKGLQHRKLAVEIAKHISDDYSRIVEEFKK